MVESTVGSIHEQNLNYYFRFNTLVVIFLKISINVQSCSIDPVGIRLRKVYLFILFIYSFTRKDIWNQSHLSKKKQKEHYKMKSEQKR